MEVNLTTGDLIDSKTWGGADDDSFAGIAAAQLDVGPRLFVVGTTKSYGNGGSDVAILRVDTDRQLGDWQVILGPTVARRSHQTTLLRDGRVLVSGGWGNTQAAVTSAEVYDPVSNVWAVTGDSRSARADHTATLLADGRVLAAGGVGNNASCTTNATSEVYSPVSGVWADGPSAPVSFGTGHSAIRLNNGRVLVSGGGNRCGTVFRSAALFDPTTSSWTRTGDMIAAREFHSSILLPDGRILVAGGVGQSSLFLSIASAEIYDPTTGQWTAAPDMATPRSTSCNGYMEPFLATLPNGKVMAAAGYRTIAPSGCLNGHTRSLSALAEVFDVASLTWAPAAPLSTPRAVTTLTPLLDGRVLVAGGTDGTQDLDTAELFNPTTGIWDDAAPMSIPRSTHSATRLLNGRVLLISGNTAEIFSPAPGLPPMAPSGLTAVPTSATTARLMWTDNSGNETGFSIERKLVSTGDWAVIATVAVNVRTYMNSNLTRGQSYLYRVRATGAEGDSGYSNEATLTMPTPPVAPTGLSATGSGMEAALVWADNSTNEDGFKIVRKTGSGGTWMEIATVAANTRAYRDSGLVDGSTYYYKVRSYNVAGNSAYSNVGSVAIRRPLPDFVVTNITLSPTSPAVNANFSATVTVRNQGTGSGDGGWLDVWMHQAGTPTCGAEGNRYESVGTLDPGASVTFTFPSLMMRVGGAYTFSAFTDSFCQTEEGNETNNRRTKNYSVR